MTDYKYRADRDRERAYKDSDREVIVFCAFIVGGLMGACSTLFWIGVTA